MLQAASDAKGCPQFPAVWPSASSRPSGGSLPLVCSDGVLHSVTLSHGHGAHEFYHILLVRSKAHVCSHSGPFKDVIHGGGIPMEVRPPRPGSLSRQMTSSWTSLFPRAHRFLENQAHQVAGHAQMCFTPSSPHPCHQQGFLTPPLTCVSLLSPLTPRPIRFACITPNSLVYILPLSCSPFPAGQPGRG